MKKPQKHLNYENNHIDHSFGYIHPSLKGAQDKRLITCHINVYVNKYINIDRCNDYNI